jgi:uncharacterized protein (DUF427 family)
VFYISVELPPRPLNPPEFPVVNHQPPWRTTPYSLCRKMPRATATFNGKVIAEADHYETVEGNIYVSSKPLLVANEADRYADQFPPDTVDQSVLVKTDTHYTCSWKGVCSQYSIKVNGNTYVMFLRSTTALTYRRSGSYRCSLVLSGPEGEGSKYQGPHSIL